MSGPTLIAKILPKASKAIMGKHKSRARISMARLIDGWAEIIAPEDPLQVQPVRIGWKWNKQGDKIISSEGTLYIACPSALATRLKFQEAIIIGRVNRLFGLPEDACIRRIALSHDRLAPPLKRGYKTRGVVGSDTQQRLDGIEDPVLKERLQGLAQAMAAEITGEKK